MSSSFKRSPRAACCIALFIFVQCIFAIVLYKGYGQYNDGTSMSIYEHTTRYLFKFTKNIKQSIDNKLNKGRVLQQTTPLFALGDHQDINMTDLIMSIVMFSAPRTHPKTQEYIEYVSTAIQSYPPNMQNLTDSDKYELFIMNVRPKHRDHSKTFNKLKIDYSNLSNFNFIEMNPWYLNTNGSLDTSIINESLLVKSDVKYGDYAGDKKDDAAFYTYWLRKIKQMMDFIQVIEWIQEHVRSEYVMFVEDDCPFCNDDSLSSIMNSVQHLGSTKANFSLLDTGFGQNGVVFHFSDLNSLKQTLIANKYVLPVDLTTWHWEDVMADKCNRDSYKLGPMYYHIGEVSSWSFVRDEVSSQSMKELREKYCVSKKNPSARNLKKNRRRMRKFGKTFP